MRGKITDDLTLAVSPPPKPPSPSSLSLAEELATTKAKKLRQELANIPVEEIPLTDAEIAANAVENQAMMGRMRSGPCKPFDDGFPEADPALASAPETLMSGNVVHMQEEDVALTAEPQAV